MKEIDVPAETIITKITEESQCIPCKYGPISYTGYNVATTVGDIFLGISNDLQYCGNWGYLIKCKEKDLAYYVGAKVIKIVHCSNGNDRPDYLQEEKSLPLNIKTDRGDIDLWVYNDSSGLYSHATRISVFSSFEKNSRI